MDTPEITVDVVMDRRFILAEEIALIEGRHKAELEPLKEELRMCEMFVKDAMNKGNMQQLKIASGHQAFFTTKDSATVEDWDLALDSIRNNSAWHLLNRAVNKTAVKEYVEANKVPPPGVKYESYRDLSWRRGKGA